MSTQHSFSGEPLASRMRPRNLAEYVGQEHHARPLPTTEYDLLDLLDRLESLVEDMDDLTIRTHDEAEALIATIHTRLDEMEKD